ncbi:MAG: hypothetical protein HY594_00310 [Candidatus Omnitrophica bacterium]|nr:hypothetical protein [Candidatus Omnitrophota bacterium]
MVVFIAAVSVAFPADAARQQVYVTGAVGDFGSYTFTPGFSFNVTEPGAQLLGIITVDGVYNGEYPWIMRIYTENAGFDGGIAGAIHPAGSAGLISTQGKQALALEVHCPNFGTEVWRRIPDLAENPYLPYRPSPDPDRTFETTDCILIGIDPRNAPWVAGRDGRLFTGDDNALGDATLKTPFEILIRTQPDGHAVQGQYEGLLYIEIVPAP